MSRLERMGVILAVVFLVPVVVIAQDTAKATAEATAEPADEATAEVAAEDAAAGEDAETDTDTDAADDDADTDTDEATEAIDPADVEPVPEGELPEALAELVEDAGLTEEEDHWLRQLPDHILVAMDAEADESYIASPEHLKILVQPRFSAGVMEQIATDRCVLCHTDPDSQDAWSLITLPTDGEDEGEEGDEAVPSHLNLTEMVNDVHFRRGLSCAGCHGGNPRDEDMTEEITDRWPGRKTRKEDRTWIPEFCGGCHADPTFMRRFDPSLPTDQLAKYRDSNHGRKVLGDKDSKAATCVDCHGVHGIRDPDTRLSKVHPTNIADTCGHCHSDAARMKGYTNRDGDPLPTDQVESWKKSVHGHAMLEKDDLGAPTCNDCHGNHAAMPPEVQSVSQVCRTCHVMEGKLFDGSQHKKAFEKQDWPECESCHGNHGIHKTSDEMVGDEPGTVCFDCHNEHGKEDGSCGKAASFFRTEVEHMAHEIHGLEPEIERLAEMGLDVDGIVAARGEAEDGLKTYRASVHAFDKNEYEDNAEKSKAPLNTASALITAAEEEFGSRTMGLVISIALMGLMAVSLLLKVREIEVKQAEERELDAIDAEEDAADAAADADDSDGPDEA